MAGGQAEEILIKNAQILEVSSSLESIVLVDLIIKDHFIANIFKGKERRNRYEQITPQAKIIDASNLLLAAGFIDMHVHLREPGFEAKETIASGTKAAARGGFTTIAAMPNTRPVIDSVEMVSWIQKRAQEVGVVRVLPIPAMTIGSAGEEVGDFAAYLAAGVVGVTDDGRGVEKKSVMESIFKKAQECGLIIMQHSEMHQLSAGGVVNQGKAAERFKLPVQGNEAEYKMVERDADLAEKYGVHLHIQHISTKESVEIVRQYKKRGVKISAEVTPHHLTLTDADIVSDDANYKMNPPLRTEEDRQALIVGLLDGTIDCIATDHAPHTALEKSQGLLKSPFGIIGLESAFPLLYTELVLKQKVLSLSMLLHKMSTQVAETFSLSQLGRISLGAPADLVLINLDREFTFDKSQLSSLSSNTPYLGSYFFGKIMMTIANGGIVWERRDSDVNNFIA